MDRRLDRRPRPETWAAEDLQEKMFGIILIDFVHLRLEVGYTVIRPTYTIDLEHGCIFIKWSGVVKAHDIIAFNREIEQDPDYRSGLNRLADFRQSEVVTESHERPRVVINHRCDR